MSAGVNRRPGKGELDALSRGDAPALTETLRAWPGGLVVASHDREFLGAIGCERAIDLGA